MGEIAGRRANSKNPATPQQAATRIAIEMRRVLQLCFASVPELLLELDSIQTPNPKIEKANNNKIGNEGFVSSSAFDPTVYLLIL